MSTANDMAGKKQSSRVLKKVDVCDPELTRKLVLKKITYIDKDGKESFWESAERKKSQGVVTVACKTSGGKYVVISQYRPTVDTVVYSFPAGLVDEGETPAKAAARELLEETGFVMSTPAVSTSTQLTKSAGMTNETSYFLECNSSGRKKQDLKDEESIDVHLMRPSDVIDLGASILSGKAKANIASDLWAYMLAKARKRA